MSQKEGIHYELYSEYLLATGYGNDEVSKITYVEHQDVRDAVMALMEAVVSGYEREIFSQTCGCCGQCCGNRTVLVNAREITGISCHLDISETLCRASYIVPAATWNEHDGIVALKNNECIFLEQGSSGTCKCAIFPVRPSSCRELMPAPERCTKDPGKLLTHVERLEIEPHALTCHLTSGSHYRIERKTPCLQDALRKFHEVVYPCRGMTQSQLDHMSGDAHRLLDWVLDNYEAGVSAEILLPRFSAIKGIVDDIDTLTLMREKAPQDLELLWLKVRHLDELLGSGDGKGNEAATVKADSPRDDVPVAICFQPTALSIEITLPHEPLVTTLHYQQHGRLLSLVRQFIEALVTSKEPGLVDVLGHSDPYCFMCGVCCGSYDLEATAVDIERLADYLKIPETEVWEKYLEPGTRSWNRRDGLLRRLKKAHYEGECMFLKAKSPTESVCGIYEARPQICRDYQANTRLCQKQSLVLRGYEHIGNIISCHVADDIVRLTTHHTQSHNKDPFATALKDNDELREMFHNIKAEVLQILGSGISKLQSQSSD